jgi:hypothetical protein
MAKTEEVTSQSWKVQADCLLVKRAKEVFAAVKRGAREAGSAARVIRMTRRS